MTFGGVQFTANNGACGSGTGENVGQGLVISVDLLVPTDALGRATRAGPYFRSRAATRGDGILGGTSAGYWVQLLRTG